MVQARTIGSLDLQQQHDSYGDRGWPWTLFVNLYLNLTTTGGVLDFSQDGSCLTICLVDIVQKAALGTISCIRLGTCAGAPHLGRQHRHAQAIIWVGLNERQHAGAAHGAGQLRGPNNQSKQSGGVKTIDFHERCVHSGTVLPKCYSWQPQY